MFRPGAWLGLLEVVQGPGGEPDYPTPWEGIRRLEESGARIDGPRVPFDQHGTWPATRIGGLFFLFSGNRSTRRWLKTGGSECDSALATLSVARYSSAVSYRFEWDPAKARSNLREHTVSFDEASTVFGDPLSLLMPDPDHSQGEERYLVLGMSLHRRLLVVSHLERPPLTRLISARPATRSERKRYEQGTL